MLLADAYSFLPFLLSLLGILYILVGYPLLLALLAKRCSRPVIRAPILPTISFLIPVHNGERFLAKKLDSILALDYPREKMQIFVASDGSSDNTNQVAQAYAAQDVRWFDLPRGGKPAALNATIPYATGDILILTDVRQELAVDSVRLLVEAFADPTVGTVSGELRIRQGDSAEETDIGLYWKFETWIRNRLSEIDSMFGATGPFYAIRRELATPIPPDTLLDDMYLPLTAFFQGYRLLSDPRALAYDYPTSRQTEFQRKVRTLAGNYQILYTFPQLLTPVNRMWLHFLSYKFGRLLLPWLLLAALLSSLLLPPPFRLMALGGQLFCYLLAAADTWIPSGFPLKKLSSPARTFLTMMVATVVALKVLFVPARSLWKVTSAGNLQAGKR